MIDLRVPTYASAAVTATRDVDTRSFIFRENFYTKSCSVKFGSFSEIKFNRAKQNTITKCNFSFMIINQLNGSIKASTISKEQAKR